MTRNGKRLTAATLIELVARTTSKVQVKNTTRGFKKTSVEDYAQATLTVKNEMSARGMLNV